MRARTLLAGGLVAAVAVAGCSSGDPELEGLAVTDTRSPPARTSTPPAPTPTETPTVTEPPTETEEPTASSREQDLLDIAEASQALEDHRAVIRSGEEPLEYLDHVAEGRAWDTWASSLRGDLEAGHTQTGVGQVEVLDVEWTSDDTVTVQLCIDVSGVDILDQDGNSVVAAHQEDRQEVEQDLRRTSAPGMYQWTVTDDRGSGAPCDD